MRPTLIILVTPHAQAAHQTERRLCVEHGCSAHTRVHSLQNVEVLLESIMDAADVLERSHEDAKVRRMLSSSALYPQNTPMLPKLYSWGI